MSKHNQSFSSTQSNNFYRVFGCLQHPRRRPGHTVKHDAWLKKSIEPTQEKGLNWNSERCVFRMAKLTFMAYLLSKRGLGTTEPLVRTGEPKKCRRSGKLRRISERQHQVYLAQKSNSSKTGCFSQRRNQAWLPV